MSDEVEHCLAVYHEDSCTTRRPKNRWPNRSRAFPA